MDKENKEILEELNDKKVKSQTEFTEEEEKKAKELFDAMNMPIQVTKDQIQFGARELDIRKLSNKDIMQLFFRTQVSTTLHLNDISRSLLDLTRLFMAFLYRYGVEDIAKEVEDTLEKLQKEAKKITDTEKADKD